MKEYLLKLCDGDPQKLAVAVGATSQKAASATPEPDEGAIPDPDADELQEPEELSLAMSLWQVQSMQRRHRQKPGSTSGK